MTARIATLAVGVLVGLYGAYLLVSLGWSNLVATVVWLVGGVVLHDGVFAGLTLAVAFVALRLVRPERLAPWVVAAVILVPVTLLSIPELGRFGKRTDTPTLLDRNYWLGWVAVVVVVAVGVVAGTVIRSRRGHPGPQPVEGGDDDGTRAGGR